MVTQVEIARRIGLDVSSVNKILNRRPGPVFKRETIRRVFRIAKELGYDFSRLKYHHRRRHPRKPVKMGADFSIYGNDGSLFDQGSATILDISLSGARISDLNLPQNSFPTGPFTVTLRPRMKIVDDLEIAGRMVRLHTNGGSDYGIRFNPVQGDCLRQLKKVATR